MKRTLLLLFASAQIFSSYHTDVLRKAKELHPLQANLPIRVSGYVKWESYADSRQVVGAGNDQYLIFPKKKDLDLNCQDINAKGQFQMVAIQSRLHLDADGPTIGGATSLGILEADFFGKSGIVNILRMRHAYIKLMWKKVSILAGQFWHVLFIPDVAARVLSFNGGNPIECASRNPQLRITYKATKQTDFIVAASTELDNASDGPIGFSTTYMRHALVPMLDAQIQTRWRTHIFGIGADYKRIVPRLETNAGVKAHESLNGFLVTAYGALNWDSVSTYLKFIFAQNAVDQLMAGGYAVHCIDPVDDHREYTNLNAVVWWNDTEFNYHDKFVPGWFVGIIKNIGARKTIFQNVTDSEGNITEQRIFGLGTDIDYVFRISPRLTWKAKNFMFGAEFEYTRAAYGTINNRGEVINTSPVGNFRVLLTMFYYL